MLNLINNEDFINEIESVYNNDIITDRYKQMLLSIIIEKTIIYEKYNKEKIDDKISDNFLTKLFEYKQSNIFNHNIINVRLDLLQDAYLKILFRYKYIYETNSPTHNNMIDYVQELYKRELAELIKTLV